MTVIKDFIIQSVTSSDLPESVGVVLLGLVPLGLPLPHLLYPRGWGRVYKEGNRVGYNMI
jgi:hypothetical protein